MFNVMAASCLLVENFAESLALYKHILGVEVDGTKSFKTMTIDIHVV